MKVKHMMLLIVPLSIVMAMLIWLWLVQLGKGLDEVYGPDGLFGRRREFARLVSEGKQLLRDGDFRKAEIAYKSALALRKPVFRYAGVADDSIGDERGAMVGLAAAVAGQGRLEETDAH